MTTSPVAGRTLSPIASAACCLAIGVVIGLAAGYASDTVHAVAATALTVGILLFYLSRKMRERPDGAWWYTFLVLGLVLRLGGSLVFLLIGYRVYGGLVDFVGYHRAAVSFAPGLWLDPLEFFGSMVGTNIHSPLNGILALVGGPGIMGVSMMSSVLGFLGALLFLRAVELRWTDARARRFAGLLFLFLPTFAYWASGFGKDSLVFFFLGLATYHVARLERGFHLHNLIGIGVALYAITMLRPPAGAIVSVAWVSAWFFCGKRSRGPEALLRPLVAVAFVCITALVVVVAGRFVLTQYQISEVSSLESALMPVYTHAHRGLAAGEDAPPASGSSLPVKITEPTLGQMLRFVPEGMFTFLFRPMFFDAHNALAAAAAVETSFLLLVFLVRWRRLLEALRLVWSDRLYAFSFQSALYLTIMFGFERNLGVIVRHRSMALPFLIILLATPRRSSDSPASEDVVRGMEGVSV